MTSRALATVAAAPMAIGIGTQKSGGRSLQSVEILRGNADDGEADPADSQDPADKTRIGPKRGHPEPVIQHRDRRRAWRCGIVALEHPSKDRTDAEHREVIPGDELAGHLPALEPGGDIAVAQRLGDDRKGGELTVLIPAEPVGQLTFAVPNDLLQ